VGTDCSGLEAPLLALRKLGFSNIKHMFSSEVDDKVRAVLLANFHPEVLYRDIRDRDPHSTAEVDVYVAGFPCQPFSSSGSRYGFLDPDGRGTVFRYIYGYIRAKEPTTFVLENVPGLLSVQGGACFHDIIGALRSLRVYNVYWDVLNAEDFGSPQHRPRVFIVGILKDCDCGFSFPRLRPRGSLDKCLLPRRQRPGWGDLPGSRVAKTNVLECLHKLFAEGHRPFHQPWVLNAGAAPGRCHIMYDRSPCLTRSRTSGHWLCNRGRFMHISEMMKLQGFPSSYRWGVSSAAFGAMLGNSMCVTVLEALFECVLRSSGLLEQSRHS
jgi:site-specific DNA-cytosine methylase